ncbi:MAG: hypothetical protein V4749_03515 [Pseudomonadota bacterium]
MGNICRGNHHSLMACSLSALMGLCSSIQAAGNGEIVIVRTVQAHAAGNPPMRPDPNPVTVNANPSDRVLSTTQELTDGDFAGVSSGSLITRSIMPTGSTLPGLNTSNGLPGMSNGHGGGSGGTLSNTISSSISQGMRPLSILSQGK